jgi:hypothetical protein
MMMKSKTRFLRKNNVICNQLFMLLFSILLPIVARGTSLRSTITDPTPLPFPPLHSCPSAQIIELTRTKTFTSLQSTKQWKTEMDRVIQVVSKSGGGFGTVKAKLRPESPVLVIHLKTPSKTPFRSPASHFFSCSDPRVNYPGLFTPGGDLGEFIIGLSALESAQKPSIPFQQQDITSIMSDYLNTMNNRHGKSIFYACTDDLALQNLAEAARVSDPLNPASHIELARILELVAIPENWGSKHLRRMMKDGEGYYVRPQLVKNCITSFMRIHLDKSHPLHDKTMLHSLPGEEGDDDYDDYDDNDDNDDNDDYADNRSKDDAEKLGKGKESSSSTHDIPYLEIVRKQSIKCTKELPMFECTEYPCDGLAPIVFARESMKGERTKRAVVIHRDDVNLYRAELSKFFFSHIRSGSNVPESFGPEKLLLGQINIGSIHADLTRKSIYSESSRYTVSFVGQKDGDEEDTAALENGEDESGEAIENYSKKTQTGKEVEDEPQNELIGKPEEAESVPRKDE